MLKAHHAILALAILFAFCGDSWGRSQRPSPRVGESVEPPHTQSSESNKDSTTNQRGTEQSPLVVKVLPSPESAERAAADARREDEKAASDRRIALFTGRLFWATVALSFIALCQLFAFLWQGWQLRRTVSLSQAEFLASHRPLLALRFVTLTLDDNDRVGIEFGVVNIGISNANVVGSSVNAEFLLETEWPNPHDYPVNNIVSPRRFVPGATDRYVVQTNEFASLTEVYLEGLRKLRLYGYIVYADDAQNTRTTYFCRVYDRESDRFIPVKNTDYETAD